MKLKDLPHDILLVILSKVEKDRDALVLACACRQFNMLFQRERSKRLVAHTNRLFKEVNFHSERNWWNRNFEILRIYDDRPKLTWECVKTFPYKDWQWTLLCSMEWINSDVVSDNIDKPWDFDKLSQKETIGCDVINKFIHKPWNWKNMSYRQNISEEFVNEHTDKDWNFRELSLRVPWSVVKQNVNKPWSGLALQDRRDFQWKYVLENPHVSWNWRELSLRDDLPITFLVNNCDLKWDWRSLSSTRKLTDIIDHPNLPWITSIVKFRTTYYNNDMRLMNFKNWTLPCKR